MNPKFPCPCCKVELTQEFGAGTLHVGDPQFGITLFCANKECKIEVMGHTTGKKAEEAYEVITDRFKFAFASSK